MEQKTHILGRGEFPGGFHFWGQVVRVTETHVTLRGKKGRKIKHYSFPKDKVTMFNYPAKDVTK
jgi:hypothetical protein